MSPPLADHADREAIRSELDRTLVVEAAAGTGKTTALVGRIIEILKTGRGELRSLIAVTFTEKAAGELKLRLRAELEKARSVALEGRGNEVSKRLDVGLMQLEEAHIGTIHGFCADLLKERPVEAGVDPLFEVATEEETERLYNAVFNRWLEDALDDPPEGVRRLLRRAAMREQGPIDDLYRAGLALIDIRDFGASWQIRPFDREGEIDDLIERLLRLGELSSVRSNDRDYLYRDLAAVRAFVQDLRGQELVSGKRDYDLLEHLLPRLYLGKRKGRGRYGEGVSRDELLAERQALSEALSELDERAGADRAAHLQHDLGELVERYEDAKAKRGRLDFLDLLVKARDLLRDHAELRRELQARFSHIFVDEFQDTDPLQAEILLLLASEDPEENDWRKVRTVPGKLFVVADPKQSIYRFRRADVSLYHRIKRQLVAAGAKPVYLRVSFRSVPEIQELVNTAMRQRMKRTEHNHQADYVPLEPYRPRATQPALVALPIPRPYSDWGRLAQYAMQRSEPEAVASWVRWLVEESGWEVTSREEGDARPVTPSDVCLLFRRFRSGDRSVTAPYVEALQGLDVPHVLVGGRGFHQREEIEAMRVALTAIERPDDEQSVFATLRGPLFSLADDLLLRYRHRFGPLHPFRSTDAASGDGVRRALDILARLHRQRNYRPIALTIRELLDATRAQAGFALWQAGDQVLQNVLRLMQLARSFEHGGGLSFRGFVEQLDALADKADQTEQPLIEDGVEGVRLMTVHKAKGLEFPVVVLCDITCNLSMGASRHVDPERNLFAVRFAGGSPWELLDHQEMESERDAAEGLRLLYVAATRARDVLAVPVVADAPADKGWVGPLLPALYPEPKAYRLPMVAPKCPPFHGKECVIERPGRADVMPGEGIRPGLHKSSLGGHEIVWWDPEHFVRQPETKPGLRRYWILQAGESETPAKGEEAHTRWSEERRATIDKGSSPSYRVATVSAIASDETWGMAGTDAVTIEEVPERDPARPTGKRFGSLVHELMAAAALDTSVELEPLARSLARALDATEAEIEAAVTAVERAREHPLLQSAREAAASFRETPFVYRDGQGHLIEGVPDLVFRSEPEAPWTVVDFKTDLRADMTPDAYRRQVTLYVQALEDATGAPARGVLLYV